MKHILIILCLGLLVFISCEKQIDGPYLQYGANPVIVTPTNNTGVVLKEDNAKNIFSNILWTDASFGYLGQVTYEVQLGVKGTNFADPITLGSVNRPQLNTVTVERLNTILIGRGFAPDKALDLEMRITSKVSNEVNILYSKSLDLKVTPYKASLNFPKLQVPGSYQGWNPADNNTVIYSLKSDDKYEGFLYFTANTEFKYTVGPKWDINYGDKGADGSLELNGDNIKAANAGYYQLRVNLIDNTHSLALTKWGVIGTATANNWDSDQDMTLNESTGIWTATLPLKVGELKFRANDDWGINFGDTGANLSLEYNGDNLAITEAGNYEVQLILNTPLYTYKITKKN